MRAAFPLRSIVLGLGLAAAGAALGRSNVQFQHLDVAAGRIWTRLAIPLLVKGSGFNTSSVNNREAMFGGHPYQVSVAVLTAPDGAVMVHAERVADGSGASNYDNLPAADWPDSRFRLRSLCAVIDRSTIAEEHDLTFLDTNGWNPEGALALRQYLATTPDHNQEVVLSLVVHVPSCADHVAAEAGFAALRHRLAIAATGSPL